MSNYKRFLHNQLEKAKSTASEFISSKNEEDSSIELDTGMYNELLKIADTRNSSVQHVANEIIAQYLAAAPQKLPHITVEQKEDNPLLYLDALCKHED
ncbi:hypothetical protein D3C73_611270 [compost metagenome]